MKPKNILIICTSSEIGGGPEHVWQLLSKIDKELFQFILAVPNNGPYFERFKKIKGVEVYNISIRKLRPGVLWDLWKLVRDHKIDLIHSHGKGAGLYSRLLKIITWKPVVHTLHGIHYQTYSPVTAKIYLLLEKILSYFTDIYVNVSEGERKLAEELGIYKSKKSIVIYNGVQIPGKFLNKSDLKKRLKLNSPVIINVARFNPQKGHEYLIRAMAKITEKYPESHLIMLGHGEKFEEMLRLARSLRLETKCAFLGFKDNVSEYLQASDIYVSSSLWEGLPIAVLEALSNKVSVVATDVVGNNEIVKNKVTGLLCSPRNPDDLAQKAIQLIGDEKLRSELSENGFKLIKEKFSLERMVSQTRDVYLRFLR